MRIGDLVTLAWGEHPRRAGIIIDIYERIDGTNARVEWFQGVNWSERFHIQKLELVNENR